jgi:DNA repair protein RecN (Recombination protein N)
MVVEITVENLAIIEHTQLTLGPGFTVLTGETGAGKSLLIDAVELALGDRADADLVRAGAQRAVVNLVVDLTSQPLLRKQCEELGIGLEDNLLYITREVFAEGRSQCRVGGKLTPVAALRQLGQTLVDLHGQHDHQSLLHPDRHMGFLDDWIGAPVHRLLETVGERYCELEDLRKRLAALHAGLRDREHRVDLLTYQVNEIETVCPVVGELEELEGQLSRLKHAEKLASAAMAALAQLSDSEVCAYDQLSGSVRCLDDVSRLDATLNDVLEPLRSSLYSLEEGVRALRNYFEQIESDPQKLEDTAGRIDALKRLRRKYGEDEAAVLDYLVKSQHELALLTEGEGSEEELAALVSRGEEQLAAVCGELTALRTSKAAEFSSLVERELRELAMEKALLEVRIDSKQPDSSGADRIEFFFSANAGEPLRPLAKIASGGEVSRVMLAIKSAMAGRAGVPTLVFDEVDAGLGGRAAQVVARKLEELATHYQVIVISHLPQIASRALTHFRIEKSEQEGRVRTGVRALSGTERVDEIARMLAGENLSESARATAREMLHA